MGHIALYREWRPRTFDEVVEQSHTVAALKQAVLSGNIAHAYLFSGTRGTGKTTMAQVFSRAINCLSPVNGNPCNQCSVCTGILNGTVLDVIEMDAASNNSVDTIRRLCDEIVFTPSVARFKVYIIDEVHMLSTGAFNALLKTLEEPPAHAVFILATTEQHRIPATILSRCQRYEFRRIPVASIVERLLKIADADGVPVTEDALKTIAQMSDGALRDAISLLDQAKGSFQRKIEKEDILSLVGVVNDDFMNQMALAVVNKDPGSAMKLVEEFILDGRDVIRFTMDLAAYFRNVMICHVAPNPEELVYVPAKTLAGMKETAALLSLESVLELIRQLSSLVSDLRWSLNTRITFEIALIRLMDSMPSGSVKSVSPSRQSGNPLQSQQVHSQIVSDIPVQTQQNPGQIIPAEPVPDHSELIKTASEQPAVEKLDDITQITVEPSFPVQSERLHSISETKAHEPEIDSPQPDTVPAFSGEDFSDFESLSREDGNYLGFPPDEFVEEPLLNATPAMSGLTGDDPFISKTDKAASLTAISDNSAPLAANIFEISEIKPTIPQEADPIIPDSKEDFNQPALETTSSSSFTADSPVKPEIKDCWPRILDSIISAGQMTIYLFLLPAKPVWENDTFRIIFEDKDVTNYRELSQKNNHQIITQAVLHATGTYYETILALQSEENIRKSARAPADNPEQTITSTSAIDTDSGLSGMDSLKKSAEELGISFHMEE